MLVSLVVGLGVAQVAQRNAVFLTGYALGERTSRVHTQETDVSWLNAHVVGLSSPAHLSQVAQERRLKLVAWTPLTPIPPLADSMSTQPNSVASDHQGEHGGQSLMHVAAIEPAQQAANDDTAD